MIMKHIKLGVIILILSALNIVNIYAQDSNFKKYTAGELDAAIRYLEDYREELSLTEYWIDTKNNGLHIGSEEWTEEKKQKIIDETKITDIEFVTVGPIVINDDNSYFRVEKVYWEFIKSSEEKVNNNTNIHKTQNDINAFGKFISPVEGYNYNGFNYYSLRDLAVILNFDVSYDNGFFRNI